MFPYWTLDIETLAEAIDEASEQEHGESLGEYRWNPVWEGSCHKSSGGKRLGALSIRQSVETLLIWCMSCEESKWYPIDALLQWSVEDTEGETNMAYRSHTIQKADPEKFLNRLNAQRKRQGLIALENLQEISSRPPIFEMLPVFVVESAPATKSIMPPMQAESPNSQSEDTSNAAQYQDFE